MWGLGLGWVGCAYGFINASKSNLLVLKISTNFFTDYEKVVAPKL
jgi:hypothetical protein